MASNQVSNQRGPARTTYQSASAGGRPREDYSQDATRDYGSLGDVANRATEYYERGEEQLRQCMTGREGSAIMLSLAAGLGVGFLIGAAIGRSHQQSQSWRDRIAAEGFGKRLMERIESLVPDALAEHFHK